ncbi:AAA family ATPase [Brachybacterium sp. SW0106-09]|uniref:AAA family ATPase n=1 Tax=Brachybacterium sp. SW0106-09 TaxID=1704590 RepID=UPI000A896BDA|nr:AAA family ATPase [Brachybacterium sp. SW0106-09]
MEIQLVSDLGSPGQPQKTLWLVELEWNDWWAYENLYAAQYRSSAGTTIHLGQVKIEYYDAPATGSPTRPIPEDFKSTTFPRGVISLGQSEDYYIKLATLPEPERRQYCDATHDAVWDSSIIRRNKSEPAIRKSLLRSVPLASVTGALHRILLNEGGENFYRVQYRKEDFTVEFVVDPESRPRTNLQAIIGRNGVGKTTMLRHITELLATGVSDDPNEELLVFDKDGDTDKILAGVQYVSWSAFDGFEAAQGWRLDSGITYSEIGIEGIFEKALSDASFKKPQVRLIKNLPEPRNARDKVVDSFVRSFSLVLERRRTDLWLDALDSLKSDPVFRRLSILDDLESYVDEALDGADISDAFAQLSGAFNTLSDGHKAVLLTITYMAATLVEQTLVVLDEPEAHLHPPLLSSLIRCLNSLLVQKNAMAIVATHSPVVLQEVPRSCAKKLTRNSRGLFCSPPRIETYGEDIGEITYEVFGLEVEDSGFYATLKELAARHDNYDDALAELGHNLGLTGRSALRSLIANDHPDTEDL